MNIRELLYLCRLGFKNLWSNRVYTAASVITMSICIFLFGLLYGAALNVDYILQKTGEEVYIAVFFNDDASPEMVDQVGAEIRKRPEVVKTVYVSGDDAWSSFKENYTDESSLLDGIFEGDNPLASSGNYQVYIDRAENQQAFISHVSGLEGVKKAVGSSDTIRVLLKLKALVSKLTWGSLGILLVLSILLIHNTLSVGIEAQKEKNHVMRLMGAREDFIKIPFIVEGVAMGILGVCIPLVFMTLCYQWGGRLLTESIGAEYMGTLSILPAAAVFPELFKVSLALGMMTGIVGGVSVMGRLKKNKKPKL